MEHVIAGYSIGVKWGNFKFGTHRVWTVHEYGELEAKEAAEEHIRFLANYKPEEEPRLITLYSEAADAN